MEKRAADSHREIIVVKFCLFCLQKPIAITPSIHHLKSAFLLPLCRDTIYGTNPKPVESWESEVSTTWELDQNMDSNLESATICVTTGKLPNP